MKKYLLTLITPSLTALMVMLFLLVFGSGDINPWLFFIGLMLGVLFHVMIDYSSSAPPAALDCK